MTCPRERVVCAADGSQQIVPAECSRLVLMLQLGAAIVWVMALAAALLWASGWRGERAIDLRPCIPAERAPEGAQP